MSQDVEMVSNIQLKTFWLNVRRDGPQPRIFVRSFSQITMYHLSPDAGPVNVAAGGK
jgi:hypothetical protein